MTASLSTTTSEIDNQGKGKCSTKYYIGHYSVSNMDTQFQPQNGNVMPMKSLGSDQNKHEMTENIFGSD